MHLPGSHRTFLVCPGETPENHHERSLKKQEFGVPDPLSLTLLVEEYGGIEALEAKAGSVVLFDSNAMHGSAGNISPWPPVNAYFVYNSAVHQLEKPKYRLEPRTEDLSQRIHTP